MAKKVNVVQELTREELMEKAIMDRLNRCYAVDDIPDVPSIRYLKIGDQVEIGNLSNCVVCYVSGDQKIVVVDYDNICNNYGNPITTASIGCWFWTDIYKKSNILRTDMTTVDHNIQHRFISSTISCLITKVLDFGLNDNPDYQRDYVWNDDDKSHLLDSIFSGQDIGKFILLSYAFPRRREVLDGKQRLNAIIQFYTSQYKYKNLYWHELSARDRDHFEYYLIQFADLDARHFTETDKLKLFLNVNIAGVPQSEEHLKKIKDKLTKLTK